MPYVAVYNRKLNTPKKERDDVNRPIISLIRMAKKNTRKQIRERKEDKIHN